jgi:hypothetical protein
MFSTQEPTAGIAPKHPLVRPDLTRAPQSPLLNDPDWLIRFRDLVRRLLRVARDISENHRLPNYPLWMNVPVLEGSIFQLLAHLRGAVQESSDRNKRDELSGFESRIWQAYQWACALMDESKLNCADPKALMSRDPATWLPSEGELLSWQRVLDLLLHYDFEGSRDDNQPLPQPNAQMRATVVGTSGNAGTETPAPSRPDERVGIMSDRAARPTAHAEAFPNLGELIEALEAQERFEISARRNLEKLNEQGAWATARHQSHSINHSNWQLTQRLSATPGYDRLVLYCNREWGESPSASNLKRVRGSLSIERRLGLFEANALSVQAVASLLADFVSPATTPQTKPEEKREAEDPPTPDMWRAFWASENGLTQTEIAKELSVSQPTVSRDIRCVKEWIAAGNKPPGLDELPRPRPRTRTLPVDPHKLGRYTEDDGIEGEDGE